MQIITNHHWHNFLYGSELTEKERADFDYVEDIDTHSFFRYRGCVYDPDEFMRTPQNEPARQELNKLSAWDGYQSDSYFSGVVLKYSQDCEQYQVGLYLS